MIDAIEKAGEEGLRPDDYHLSEIRSFQENQPMAAEEAAAFDLLLTDAFLLYTSHLLSGKVNPITIDSEWHVVPGEGDPVGLLEGGLESDQVTAAIKKAMPRHAVYRDLKKALKAYRSMDTGDWSSIAEGETIKAGQEDQRIPAIRERLVLYGDLMAPTHSDGILYDEELQTAVQRFQSRNGLDSDGNIGSKTIAAMNVSIAERVRQIEANLERWRWLSREFGDYYLKVNIASFELEVVKEGEVVRTHKVIAGKPFRQTPVFSSKMEYLVFNPTWTIPPGILNADVLPGVRKDPSYLQKKKIEVFDREGNTLDAGQIDWSQGAVKGYTYRQPAGVDNALGAVKFMFPNAYHVYLHDTPSKELFAKSERAFSSGCIRVHDPLALAEFIVNDPENWNKEKIDKLVTTRKTQTVILKEQPNVHILYWTAWSDKSGAVHFRKDIYERDQRLIEQLREKAPA